MKRAVLLLLLASCRAPTAPEPCTVWYRATVDGVTSLTMVCYHDCPPDVRAQATPDWLCT